MNLKNLKSLPLPRGIPLEYESHWKTFKESKLVAYTYGSGWDISESFRLFMRQAGVRCRTSNKLDKYIKGDILHSVKRILGKIDLYRYFRVTSHTRWFTYVPIDELKANRDLILSGRMTLLVRNFPLSYIVSGPWRDTVWSGKEPPLAICDTHPSTKKSLSKLNPNVASDLDYHTVLDKDGCFVGLYVVKGTLYLRYHVKVNEVLPSYDNFDSQVKSLWRKYTGVLK